MAGGAVREWKLAITNFHSLNALRRSDLPRLSIRTRIHGFLLRVTHDLLYLRVPGDFAFRADRDIAEVANGRGAVPDRHVREWKLPRAEAFEPVRVVVLTHAQVDVRRRERLHDDVVRLRLQLAAIHPDGALVPFERCSAAEPRPAATEQCDAVRVLVGELEGGRHFVVLIRLVAGRALNGDRAALIHAKAPLGV